MRDVNEKLEASLEHSLRDSLRDSLDTSLEGNLNYSLMFDLERSIMSNNNLDNSIGLELDNILWRKSNAPRR